MCGRRPPTLETHLCLLPDQLSIFKRYGALFGATLTILLVHAFIEVYGGSELHAGDDGNLLPVNKSYPAHNGPGATSASVWSASNNLAVRTGAVGRMRTMDPVIGHAIGNGYGMPMHDTQSASGDAGRETTFYNRSDWNEVIFNDEPKRRTKRSFIAVLQHWRTSLRRVAIVALVCYLWLLWKPL